MTESTSFKNAFPFQQDVLALPVIDLDSASNWYCEKFGMQEVSRPSKKVPTVLLERDGVQIGFAITGGDPTQDGAAILVQNIKEMQTELEARGVETGNSRIDERDGEKLQVFFVVAPDGLCYYFHEPIEST